MAAKTNPPRTATQLLEVKSSNVGAKVLVDNGTNAYRGFCVLAPKKEFRDSYLKLTLGHLPYTEPGKNPLTGRVPSIRALYTRWFGTDPEPTSLALVYSDETPFL